MALTATIYNLSVDLADIDRGVYEKLDVCIARQPSETIEYMFMRVIAYCLEYGDKRRWTVGWYVLLFLKGGESCPQRACPWNVPSPVMLPAGSRPRIRASCVCLPAT